MFRLANTTHHTAQILNVLSILAGVSLLLEALPRIYITARYVV